MNLNLLNPILKDWKVILSTAGVTAPLCIGVCWKVFKELEKKHQKELAEKLAKEFAEKIARIQKENTTDQRLKEQIIELCKAYGIPCPFD